MQGPAYVGDGNQRLSGEGNDFIARFQTGFGRDRAGSDRLNLRGLIRGEREADCFRGRPRINPLNGHGLVLFAIRGADGVADLMAVDATLHHFALPIEVGFVFGGEQGNLGGCLERNGTALLGCERRFVGRIAAMDGQRSFNRALVTGDGRVLRVALVGPRAVTTVDRAVAVEEHRGKGKVVVELEQRQVQCVRIDQPHADELIEQWREVQFRLFQNLRVNARTRKARHATQHHQQRLARALRFRKAALEVVVEPARIFLHRGAVLAHGAFTVFHGLGH